MDGVAIFCALFVRATDEIDQDRLRIVTLRYVALSRSCVESFLHSGHLIAESVERGANVSCASEITDVIIRDEL